MVWTMKFAWAISVASNGIFDAMTTASSTTAAENQGLALGFLGVLIFSLTLPATRVAVAELNPFFVAGGRSFLAGLIALAVVIVLRCPRPTFAQARALALTAIGVVFGFPFLTSWAMRYVPAAHGAVVVGLMPLATAAFGAFLMGERPSRGFWLAAVIGSTLVIGFALTLGAGSLHAADWALFAAILLGATGYTFGARVTRELGGWQTISWVLVLSLPLTAIVTWFTHPATPAAISATAWSGFLYVAIMSQYVGFFAWYRGLDIGGVARVSQTQLTQIFLTMGFAALLIGETITLTMLIFAVAVVATVAIGRMMPVARK